MVRLQAIHQRASRFGRREPTREEARPRERPPRPPPDPVYRLVPLPFRTFRQALDFGMALRIHCPRCHDRRPIELAAEQLDRPFATTRFICRHLKLKVYGEGREVCGGPGELVFGPIGPRAPERAFVDIQCVGAARGRSHTGREINSVDLHAPPWQGLLDARTQRFWCPGRGGMARHTFHYGHGPTGSVAGHLVTPTF
jgi:hypothetical protein